MLLARQLDEFGIAHAGGNLVAHRHDQRFQIRAGIEAIEAGAGNAHAGLGDGLLHQVGNPFLRARLHLLLFHLVEQLLAFDLPVEEEARNVNEILVDAEGEDAHETRLVLIGVDHFEAEEVWRLHQLLGALRAAAVRLIAECSLDLRRGENCAGMFLPVVLNGRVLQSGCLHLVFVDSIGIVWRWQSATHHFARELRIAHLLCHIAQELRVGHLVGH